MKYDVQLMNASRSNLYHETGYNIGEMNICNLTVFVDITEAQLTISYRDSSKNVSTMIAGIPVVSPTSGKK